MTTRVSQAPQTISPAEPPILLGRRVVVACLVVAPLLGVLEAATSPLTNDSTTADLAAIAAHRGVFVCSVLAGLLGTVFFVPAFVGLARICLVRSPIAARVGACVAVVSMMGFMGVRAIQAVELQTVRDGLPASTGGRLIDGLSGNPIGAVILAMFLGGTVIGVVALAVATWRTRLAPVASGLLVAFPFIDLAAPGKAGTVLSHTVLLIALCWFAIRVAGLHSRPGVVHPNEK